MKRRSITLPRSWPEFWRAAGRGTGALPGLFANPWWAGFCLGGAVALLCFMLGSLLTSLHDQYWMPFLFGGLLPMPNRWVVTGALMFWLLWRADVPSANAAVAAFCSGAWLTMLLLYDVWYHYPFLIAAWGAFLAWRAGWMLWSYPGGGLAMAALAGVVLAGAALSVDALPWDNRFSLGRSGLGNFSVTGAVLILSALAVVGLAYFAIRVEVTPRPARPALTDLIEREPRMSRYLDAVLAVTGNRIQRERRGAVRFDPAVRKLARQAGDRGVFGDGVTRAWGRRLLWTAGFGAVKVPTVPVALRFMRTPFTQPGLRCLALVRLLREGASREYERWSAARDGAAARHFARGVLLREALIEASIYFGRDVPGVALAADAGRLQQAMLAPVRSTSKPAGHVWERVAREYEQLWVQNCERLFLTRGDGFTLPLLASEDLTDANAIRAALKTPTEATGWVVDRLSALRLLDGIDLTPADLDDDPEDRAKDQLVAAFNQLIEKGSSGRDQAGRAVSLWDRGVARAGAGPPNRRAGLARVRAELAEAFSPSIAPGGDLVDFSQLSRSWLACRLVGDAPGVHHAAASLALALFVLEAEDPALAGQVAEQLAKNYLDLHGALPRAPWRMAATSEDRAEAARCATLYALWQAHLGHWAHAGGPLTLGVFDFKDDHVPETVLRTSAHLHSAIYERTVKGADVGGATGADGGMEEILRQFEALDSRVQPEGLLFDARIPGHVLARSFAGRIAALNGANS